MITAKHETGYLCPLCRSPLVRETHSLACPAGHRFDTAKEGYTNLLPVQKKRSKDPGDNKAMMQARRNFLDAGNYQRLSDELNRIVCNLEVAPNRVLDLGCGEGYYTGRLRDALKTKGAATQIYGLDISRVAVRSAAKRYADMHFCVASSFDTPFADSFFDLVLRVYAPSKSEELARIIKPGGMLLTASPGPMHHFAVKQRIYAAPRLHEDKPEQLAGFETIESKRLQWQLKLGDADMVLAFLEMTPYAWKFTPQAKQAMSTEPFECELDFRINLLRRGE